MGDAQEQSSGRWAGRPRAARALRFFVWLLPILISVVATHFIAKSIPRPVDLLPAIVWFIALGIVATGLLFVVDKLARRLLPLAALLQLSLVFPDSAPSRFKSALRTQTVRQLQERVDAIKQSGLSDDPAIAAETLIDLIAALSAHDRLTRGHAERVRAYSRMIGEEMKLPEADLDLLQWAGLAHDVGKLFVPGEILNKTSRLTDDEFEIIKNHPAWGAELCQPLRPWLGDWVDAVGEHHERWDGTGYPMGLAGDEISLAARIVSVADVYDVITSIRSYKSARSSADAREELAKCAGTQFDERVVRAFLNIALGRLRLAMGPLSWIAQIPIIARVPLVPVAGAVASVAVTSGAMLAGGVFEASASERSSVLAEASILSDTALSEPLPGTSVPLVIVLDESGTARDVRVSPAQPDVPVSSTTTTTVAPTTTIAPPTTVAPTPTTVQEPTTTTTTSTTTTTVPPIAALVAENFSIASLEGDSTEIDVGLPNETGLIARVLQAPSSGIVEQIDGTLLRFSSAGDFYGDTSFAYELRGPLGRTSSAQVSISVTPMPDSPRAADDIATVVENGSIEIDVLANDIDPDGDSMNIALVSSTNGIATTDGTTLLYSPAHDQFGTHLVTYIVEDGTGRSDRGAVRVAVSSANSAPVVIDPGMQSIDEGVMLSFTVAAVDPDVPADGLMFSLVDGATPVPAGAVINPTTGVLTWTPTESHGATSYSFGIRAVDDGVPALADEVGVIIAVNETNQAPALVDPGPRVVDEDATLTFVVSASDQDDPVDNLLYTATGLPPGAALDSVSGAFSWTPTESQGGQAFPVIFTVTDDGAGALTDSESATLTAIEVNEAPILAPIGDRTPDEGAELAFSLAATDADLPIDGLTFAATGLPAGASLNASTGQFSWTPSETQDGTTFSVTFAVADDGAGTLRDEELVRLTATEVNSSPVVVDPGMQSVDEGALLSLAVAASDPDLPLNGLVFSLVDGATPVPAGASIDTASGVISWTPSESQGGSSYSFRVRVTDDGGPSLFSEVDVGVDVDDVNVPPLLGAVGDQVASEGLALSFTVTASDPDLPTDVLAYSATGLPAGAVLDSTSGVFSWTPSEAQGGASFPVTLTVTDDGSGLLADSESVTLTATEVNQAPVLTDPGAQTGAVGATVNLALAAADADLPTNTLQFSAVGLPAGVALNTATGVFSGSPSTIESVVVTVTVAETDGSPSNLTDSVSFLWTVTPNHILISEIATSGPGGNDDEFIELYNPTGSPVAIGGWEIRRSDGDMNPDFTSIVPSGVSIGANEYFLITHDSVRVALSADAWYSSGTMDSGAGVALLTAGGVEVDAVGTGPVPWKDGSGSLYGEGTYLPPMSGSVEQSYERKSGIGNCIDTDDNSADFFHNMTTRNPQGSGTSVACGTPPAPGAPAAVDHLVISEFRFDGPGGGDDEFVEIFNPTSNPIALLGYELRSQDGDLEARISVSDIARLGTGVIRPGEHLVFGSSTYDDGVLPYDKVDIRTAGGIRNGEGAYLVAPARPLVHVSFVADAVSTGGTDELEGDPLPPISGRVIHSYERLSGGSSGNCVDTDDNGADFFHNMSSENPQLLSAPPTEC